MNGDHRPIFLSDQPRPRASFEESENEVLVHPWTLVHLLDFHSLDMLDVADFDRTKCS